LTLTKLNLFYNSLCQHGDELTMVKWV